MLSASEVILIAIVLAALVLIVTNRLRADLIALLVLLTLALTHVVTPEEALSGFSRPVIFTIIGLFIITHALEDTGVMQWVGDHLRSLGGDSEKRLVIMLMGTGVLLALVMNIIAAGAVLLPVAVRVARDSNIRPSKLLIPASFGTLLGGMSTYFATANVIMSSVLQEQGQEGLGITDFMLTGGLIALAGLAYMVLVGRRLLPDRESVGGSLSPHVLARNLYETYRLNERLWEVRVPPGSRLVNVPLSHSHIGEELGIAVIAIWRNHHAILTPGPLERIKANDYLLLLGNEDSVSHLVDWGVLVGRENGHFVRQHDYAVDLTEVVIPPRSNAVGKTLSELRFRSKYGVTTVALWREGQSICSDVGKIPLQVGDALLMVGPARNFRTLAQERDFLVLQSSHAYRPPLPQKAGWALAITALVLLAAIFEIIPTAEAVLAGAVAMVLTGCLNMDEAYRAIEWQVVFLIGGMIPISIAIVNTGLADRVSAWLLGGLSPYGPLALIAGLFLATMLVTQVIGGQVTALIVGPIAVTTALEAGVNPQAIAVAVAIACSTAFLTPVAHSVNVLMMGPGGYTSGDFFRVGFGMTIVSFLALLAGMVLFWGIG
jgi:di/tricarboxylate transporter